MSDIRHDRRVIVLRHGDDPPDDRVHSHLVLAGYAPVTVRAFAGEAVPAIEGSVVGAVLHGGPFDAASYEAHPFLREEDRVIEACLARDLPLLGICQGAQQMAHVLCARTGPLNGPIMEFGYYEIEPVAGAEAFLPAPLTVTQAHWHSYDLPDGAVHLARSPLFEQQAFRYGTKAYGLQFHPEVTIEGFRRWQHKAATGRWTDTTGFEGPQTPDEQTASMMVHDAAQADWFYGFLDNLFPAER